MKLLLNRECSSRTVRNISWFSPFFIHGFFYCLFVCLEFLVPLENFSLVWRRHHCQWRAANFDLCSALMAIEQWGFFSLPHLLWHGTTVYNGRLRGPVTLTFGRWAVTTCFNDLGLKRLGFEHPTYRLRGERSNPLYCQE